MVPRRTANCLQYKSCEQGLLTASPIMSFSRPTTLPAVNCGGSKCCNIRIRQTKAFDRRFFTPRRTNSSRRRNSRSSELGPELSGAELERFRGPWGLLLRVSRIVPVVSSAAEKPRRVFRCLVLKLNVVLCSLHGNVQRFPFRSRARFSISWQFRAGTLALRSTSIIPRSL